MKHFVKLYSTILTSSIWAEDMPTRIVWITMLTLADETGFVRAAPSGLARTANVPMKECLASIKRLEAPDLETGTQEYGGRRIDSCEGGWMVLNYSKYRDFRTHEQVLKAERQKRWRDGKKPSTVDDVDGGRRAEVEVEVEVEVDGSKGEIVSPGEIKTRGDCPAAAPPDPLPEGVELGTKAVVVRDHHWVGEMQRRLKANDWNRNRGLHEARAAFKFFRWSRKIKNRMVLSPARESVAKRRCEEYGLLTVMLAIEGHSVHGDFDTKDSGTAHRGWENLFLPGPKGNSAIEKCAALAIKRNMTDNVLKAINGLIHDRGWTPGTFDVELFEQMTGEGA